VNTSSILFVRYFSDSGLLTAVNITLFHSLSPNYKAGARMSLSRIFVSSKHPSQRFQSFS
jgi:hypothetical protein